MQYVAIILPSFVSVALSERLEKKHYAGMDFIKRAGIYALLSNLATALIFQYILKLPTPILTSFENNLFLIHFFLLNLFVAVLLPIVKLAFNPRLHISIEKREHKSDGE